MELNDILKVATKANASDIHLKAGLPPIFRINGSLVPYKEAPRLTPEDLGRMTFGIMTPVQREKFKTTYELDMAYGQDWEGSG